MALAAATPPRVGAVSASPDDGWDAVRAQFALNDEVIHMSALYIASHPAPVREAIERYRRELDANPVVYLSDHNRKNIAAVLEAAADYLGVKRADDIALTDSTTSGLGLVYNGLVLGPGDEVLTTEQDYYVTHEALRLAAERKGSAVRRVSLYEDVTRVTADQLVGRLLDAITPRTRALALTWVHSSTGLKLPLERIGEEVARLNAGRDEADRILVCVDAVHGFGVEDVALPGLGCDFFVSGCHKWLFGPRGTGIVWGSEAGWSRVLPTIPSFIDDGVFEAWRAGDKLEGRTDGRRFSPGGFKAYEHQWAMREAFEFCDGIGKARIAARTHALATQLKEGLAGMRHLAVRTPMAESLSAGIVCFEVNGMTPWQAVDRMRERGLVATVTPYATRYVRLAPSIRNTPQQVEAALRIVRSLA
jgi:isopenicillin-N epimerase